MTDYTTIPTELRGAVHRAQAATARAQRFTAAAATPTGNLWQLEADIRCAMTASAEALGRLELLRPKVVEPAEKVTRLRGGR